MTYLIAYFKTYSNFLTDKICIIFYNYLFKNLELL